MKQKKNVLSFFILSIMSAFILLIITFYSPNNTNNIGIYNRLLLAFIFIIICIFGISLSFFPGWYKESKIFINKIKEKKNLHNIKRKRQGHHPDCKQFKSHTISVKNKLFCAGCLGLAIGSIVAIFLFLLYLFFINFLPNIFHFFVTMGLLFVFILYLEIILPIKNAYVHMISNIFFVIGFLFITIGIFEITGNIIYTAVSILILFLFLDTRIQLSSYRHFLICADCKEKCKMY